VGGSGRRPAALGAPAAGLARRPGPAPGGSGPAPGGSGQRGGGIGPHTVRQCAAAGRGMLRRNELRQQRRRWWRGCCVFRRRRGARRVSRAGDLGRRRGRQAGPPAERIARGGARRHARGGARRHARAKGRGGGRANCPPPRSDNGLAGAG
jgi:hypothetical protein